MRILLTVLMFILISSKSYSNNFFCKYFDSNCESVSFKKVQEREKKFYKLNSLEPFTGNIVINLKDFVLVDYLEFGEKGKVIDGIRHGEWNEYKIYNKDSDLRSKKIYEHGELRQVSYWEMGVLKKIRNYKNKTLDGKYEEWFSLVSKELRIPDVQGNYKNGKQIGCWKFLKVKEHKKLRSDYYVVKECYNSKYLIDTEIYGIGTETPLYSGKKDVHGCYSGNWFQYDFEGKVKEKINLGKCTVGGDFVSNLENLFKYPYFKE